MIPIRLSKRSAVPIHKQIVDQIRFMIEAGQLETGDRLPSSRLLAANLGVNRNTVARAYAQLRDEGLVESRRRGGMVVIESTIAAANAAGREAARDLLRTATEDCLRSGLSVDEVASLAYHYGLHTEHEEISVSFVECNAERADYFAAELSRGLGIKVTPLVLGEFEPAEVFDADLALTTFFHLSEVRRLARGERAEVVAIVVAPHVKTLVRLAQIPEDHRIGILYSTQEQAVSIRDSLHQIGLTNVEVLSNGPNGNATDVDVVIVPSEMPELSAQLDREAQIVEFGNVLDEASLRMVRQVVNDIRDRKALA